MTDKRFVNAYDRIPLAPGAEKRMLDNISAALDRDAAHSYVTVKPKGRGFVPKLLAAAAVLVLIIAAWALLALPAAPREGNARPLTENDTPHETPEATPSGAEEPYDEAEEAAQAVWELTETEQRDVEWTLSRISSADGPFSLATDLFSLGDAPFALSDYAADQTGGIMALCGMIGAYAQSHELSLQQLHGVLLATKDLDGASAEGYAWMLHLLYEAQPGLFIQAWHDVGEPAELMHDVTGIFDPEESAAWLKKQPIGDPAAPPSDGPDSSDAAEGTAAQNTASAQRILVMIQKAEDKDTELLAALQQAVNQGDMNSLAQERYELWDQCLNHLWEELKTTLNDEQMQTLTEQQRQWIQDKKAAVEEAGKEVEGGSLYPLVSYQKAAELTRERVYQLAGADITRQVRNG